MNRKAIRGVAGVSAAGFLLMAGFAQANNLQVTNVTVSARNDTTAYVQFDISWENSWRYTNVNHDAAWVFIKVLPLTGADWLHAPLAGTGIIPPDYSTGTGTDVELIVPDDRAGLFIRRAAEGNGTTDVQNIKVVWDFIESGLLKTDKVRVQVLAAEMVYVAEGEFYVGDGGSGSGRFREGASSNSPFLINATWSSPLNFEANSRRIGNTVGRLWGTATNTNDNNTVGAAGTLNDDFPTGYGAFYCMKYEVTQGQYADFLNTLTADQAAARFLATNLFRYTITANAGVYTAAAPDRACNYLSWADGAAFMDWAGLRPMTELEFEKACRGPLAAQPDEFAWGTSGYIKQTSHSGTDGSGIETALPAGANINVEESLVGGGGPVRVGIYATSASSRVEAGASYWGIMELSGNVVTRVVTVGRPAGRNFTGLHGDGVLAPDGTANVAAWPAADAIGAGDRGGSAIITTDALRRTYVSDRTLGAFTNTGRNNSRGARAVRTAPAGVLP